jgi:hypothetical protein
MNQVNFNEQKILLQMSAIKSVKELEIFSKYNLPSDNLYYSQNDCILESNEFEMLDKK